MITLALTLLIKYVSVEYHGPRSLGCILIARRTVTVFILSLWSVTGAAQPSCGRTLEPLIAEARGEAIFAELRTRTRILIETKPERIDRGYQITLARGAELDVVMREIGRLREESFRAVGEGTGRSLDLDEFDPHYLQLVSWHKDKAVISGGGRIGRAGELIAARGARGLYVDQLFEMSPRLIERYRCDAIELGRTFVRPTHQKGGTLSALWFGIARYLVENPQTQYLFGPVSISGTFHERSRELIAAFLMRDFAHAEASQVTARTPSRRVASHADVERTLAQVRTFDELQELIRVVENDATLKLPELLEMYRRLGARFFGFNWDSKFNTLDGFIEVDMHACSQAMHERFMGLDHARAYRARHGLVTVNP